jgi:hypothetical protein
MHLTRLSGRSHKEQWIKSLLKKGLVPNIVILETTKESNWQELERKWILSFKSSGVELTNSTEGGESGGMPKGFKFPPERGRKYSEMLKGHKVKLITREKLRAVNLGKKASESTKSRMSLSQKGRTHSEGTKAKMKLSRSRQVYSSEAKKKISDSVKKLWANPFYTIPLLVNRKINRLKS